jgi:hypothetical protein
MKARAASGATVSGVSLRAAWPHRCARHLAHPAPAELKPNSKNNTHTEPLLPSATWRRLWPDALGHFVRAIPEL